MQFLVTLDSCEAAEATVLGFDGREETSSDYRFVLMLGCKEEPAAIEAGTINQPVSLEMRGEGQPSRHVHGVVASVGWRGLRAAVHSFEVVLVPRLHMLRHRRTSRVFQDLGVSEIVSAILELHGVAHRWALVQPHAKRAYCVQYRETDYSFVTRLCGEEGVFFYFEHGEIGPEVVVFSDDVGLPFHRGPIRSRLSPSRWADRIDRGRAPCPELCYRAQVSADGRRRSGIRLRAPAIAPHVTRSDDPNARP
jgi:type VI secretion system secreted protein VgrG